MWSEYHVLDATKVSSICQAPSSRFHLKSAHFDGHNVRVITPACDGEHRVIENTSGINQFMLIKRYPATGCCCFTQCVLVKAGTCRANLLAL